MCCIFQISQIDTKQLLSWSIIDDPNTTALNQKQFDQLLIEPAFRKLNDQTVNLRTSSQNMKAIQMSMHLVINRGFSYAYFYLNWT